MNRLFSRFLRESLSKPVWRRPDIVVHSVPCALVFRRDLKGGKGYSQYGHEKPPKQRLFRYFYQLFHVALLTVIFAGMAGVGPLRAAQVEDKAESGSHAEDDEEDESHKEEKEKKAGFRDRTVIVYENKLRQYSTPDKIFRYFATLKVFSEETGFWEAFMTPADFLRSLTPGMMQPEGLGLDEFKKYDPKVDRWQDEIDFVVSEDSIFNSLGQNGLISFSDYIFLLTVLSTSSKHFEYAFRMFDIDGDGCIDADEFLFIQSIIRSQTTIGRKHRDHATTGNVLKENSALLKYFFGADLKYKMKVEQFLEFQRQLQRELLRMEFERCDPDEDGNISETQFAEMLLAYSGMAESKFARMLKRVKRKFRGSNVASITFDQYLKFFNFLKYIPQVDTALTFYNIAGASIDQVTLKHVAKSVANIQLDEHVIDVVFTLFDENQDGRLSHREFVAVMKNRLMHGLERPKDTGLFRLIEAICECAIETPWFEKEVD